MTQEHPLRHHMILALANASKEAADFLYSDSNERLSLEVAETDLVIERDDDCLFIDITLGEFSLSFQIDGEIDSNTNLTYEGTDPAVHAKIEAVLQDADSVLSDLVDLPDFASHMAEAQIEMNDCPPDPEWEEGDCPVVSVQELQGQVMGFATA